MLTVTSTFIKKKEMAPDDVTLLSADILLYNTMTRRIVQELRFKRDKDVESIHCEYKRIYQTSDYFVTSAERKARGIREAAEAALKLDIEAKTNNRKQERRPLNDCQLCC